MGTCTFILKKTNSESKLYKTVLEITNNAEKAEQFVNYAIRLDFLQEMGDWRISEQAYGLFDKDGNPRLYQYGHDKDGNPIYGEPLYEDLVDWVQNKQLSSKEFNDGRFPAVNSKTKKALQNAIATIEKMIHTANRQKKGRARVGALKKNKKELEKDFDILTEDAANEKMLTFAQNALAALQEAYLNLEQLPLLRLGEDENRKISDLADDIQDIYDFVQAFRGVDSMVLDFNEKRLFVTPEVAEILEQVAIARGSFEGLYRQMITDVLLEKVNTGEAILEEFAVRDIQKEFAQLRAKYRTEEERERFGLDIPFEEYLEQRLAEEGSLAKRGRTFFTKLLHSHTTDISDLQRWAVSFSEASDDLLRSMQKQIAITEDETRLKWHSEVVNLHKLRMKLGEAVKAVLGRDPVNTAELYTFMTESIVDDFTGEEKFTGYFVARYYSSWQKYLDERRQKILFGYSKEATDEWAIWMKNNVTLNFDGVSDSLQREYWESIEENAKSGDDTRLLIVTDSIDAIHKKNFTQLFIPKRKEDKEKYTNPQFQKLLEYGRSKDVNQKVLWEYYSEVMRRQRDNDERYAPKFKLGYRMPTVRKTLYEKLEAVEKAFGVFPKLFGANSFYSLIVKSYFKEETTYAPGEISSRGEEDFSETEVTTDKRTKKKSKILTQDSYGRTRQFVPVHYRGNIDLNMQTRDVHTALLYETYNSLNHSEMNKLLPYMQMALYFLESRNIYGSEAGTALFGPGSTGRNITKKESRAYEMARDEIESRMFGIRELDPGFEVGGLSVAKMLRLMRSYTSLVMLSFNWHSSMANSNLAGTVTFIESFGKEFFTLKDVLFGQKEFVTQMGQMLLDIQEPIDMHSKINVLSYIFDPLNEFDHRSVDYGQNPKLRSIANSFSLHMYNNNVEKFHQSVTMVSMLNSIKVLNEDGKFIKAGDINATTEDRNEAMSLYEALEVAKDRPGSISYESLVEGIEIKSGDRYKKFGYKSETERKEANIRITHMIQEINAMMHGNYSHRNAIPLQRTLVGSLVMQLRKYLPPGVSKRMTGIWGSIRDYTPVIGTYHKTGKVDNRYLDEDGNVSLNFSRMYNPMLDMVRSLGSYGDAYKFFGKLMSDLRVLKWHILSDNWAELDSNEKANVIRTVSELGIGILAGFSGTFFAQLASDDPENEEFYYSMAFYSFRLQSELYQYIFVSEMARILKNPAATVTMIERIHDFGSQVLDDSYSTMVAGTGPEIYKSGLRKGEWKVQKKFLDIVPFYKHWKRSEYLRDVVSFYTETNRTRQ